MCTIEEKNEYLKQLAEKDASIEAMKFKAKEFITKLKNENQATITQLQVSKCSYLDIRIVPMLISHDY